MTTEHVPVPSAHDAAIPMSGFPNRVAMLSVHTSPLDQPGTGDAGGLNVYVVELAKRLADAGTKVEIFTRATQRGQAATVPLTDGVLVRHLEAGPLRDIDKADLPGQLCALTAGVLRAEANRPSGWYDAIHSHYWLSGQVGSVASERWDVPLIHSMHTMAKVKNLSLASGDSPEPSLRVLGEQQVVDCADRLIANTESEAEDLRALYGAADVQTAVVHPGVDLDQFSPGDKAAARLRHNLPQSGVVLLFVGRIQPLKSPDVVIRATAAIVAADPTVRGNLTTVVCGGPSGAGPERLDELRKLAATLGVADIVRFVPPTTRDELADWYRAADVVCVPSHSESFGLVAIEAQACGTPVAAAAVGGLFTAVADGTSGLLVRDHLTATWRDELLGLIRSPQRLESPAANAREHAERFSWNATAAATLEVYRQAALARAEDASLVNTARSTA